VTVSLPEITLYAWAMVILVLTPGPVVAALIARSAAGGVRAAVPLALGVAVGDIFWPLAAMLGITAVLNLYAGALTLLRWIGASILLWMGWQLIRDARDAASRTEALKSESGWAGFAAGLSVIAGNPKAILFYLGLLPGFFRMEVLRPADMALICLISAATPFLGNLLWSALFSRARRFLSDPVAMRRTHVAAGLLLIAVALWVALGAK
jgi:threonine/homoserine/homoserine lactone efflux protein